MDCLDAAVRRRIIGRKSAMLRVLGLLICASAASFVHAALASPAAPVAADNLAWEATLRVGPRDQGQCADVTESYFSNEGYLVSRKTEATEDPEVSLLATNPAKPLEFAIFCRQGRDLTVIARGPRSDMDTEIARFGSSLSLPSRAPGTKSADSTKRLRAAHEVTATTEYRGTTANCLDESKAAFAQVGYRSYGSYVGRLAVGASNDKRFFAVVDCALTPKNWDGPEKSFLKIRFGTTLDVTTEARNAAATQLGKAIANSPIEAQRYQAAEERYWEPRRRLQEAQERQAQRVAQAEADAAAAQTYRPAQSAYQIDENEVARRAAGVIQSENAARMQSGGAYSSGDGYSGGAIIMGNYDSTVRVDPPSEDTSNQVPPPVPVTYDNKDDPNWWTPGYCKAGPNTWCDNGVLRLNPDAPAAGATNQ
jgi:hypothetical protein